MAVTTKPKEVKVLGNNRESEASIQELKLLAKNKWKGWTCLVGKNNLIIEDDGDVFGSVCKVGGKIGNIHTGFQLLQSPRICERSNCHCADDMKMPKAINSKELKRLLDLEREATPYTEEEFSITAIAGTEHLTKNPTLNVNWNVGRRCNFDCSYCPDSVHNATDPYPSLESLKETVKRLYEQIAPTQKIKFTLTGGEPTLIPHYLEFLGWIRKQYSGRCIIVTNTNGSKSADYLCKLLEVSAINLSLHFEFFKIAPLRERLIKLAEKRIQLLESGRKRHVRIKMIVPPGGVPKAHLYLREIQKVVPDKEALLFSMEPVIDKNNNYETATFGDTEKAALLKMSSSSDQNIGKI
ncbi:MAG: radical SAM protein [Bdellovibrionota bacterium]